MYPPFARQTGEANAAITAHTHPGLNMAYLRAGERGPVMLLLHGWGAFKELWWSTLRRLGRDHRCYALDFPGHGDTPLGSADTIGGLAEAVIAFCEDLALDQIVLVGHSMGGSVGCEIALRRPALVSRLILVDAAVDAHLMPSFARTYLVPKSGWAFFRLMLLGARIATPLGATVPHEHGGGWVRPWLRRGTYLATFEPEPLYRLYRSLFATRAGESLRAIKAPTLVLSGQLDTVVPPAHSRRVARTIPRARYVEIPGALHNPMDERPGSFEQVIREFLQEG
jgi:pimeloyl-ACP methyl ester carboxylesterase